MESGVVARHKDLGTERIHLVTWSQVEVSTLALGRSVWWPREIAYIKRNLKELFKIRSLENCRLLRRIVCGCF